MKIVKILTFLTLALFWNITIRADIDYTNYKQILGGFDRIKVANEGLILGENAYTFNIVYYNGIYLSKDIDLNIVKKGFEGSRITDLDSDKGEVFVTTYAWVNNLLPGLFRVRNNFSTIEKIGINGSLNKVHIFKDKVYYGGNNYGAWVVNRDGKNNKQILGVDGYGPQIDQIKSNSDTIFVLSRGNLYYTPYNKDSLAQLFPTYRIVKIEPTENEILAITSDKYLILDFNGKVLYEKQFLNPIGTFRKYQNYVFVTERTINEQKIWISRDLGKTFYESKTKLAPGYGIKEIELTGTDDMTIFLNFTNLGVLKAKFKFDFETNKFLGVPFNNSNPNNLVDKITSYFDHRYPYLGNLLEPTEYSDTTLNFYGKELKKPYIYYSSHDGIDFGLPMYTDIKASEKGLASYIYNPGGLGHTIIISHPNNYLTVYGHLDSMSLATTSTKYVEKGEVIGKVGMSGNTNGPHLHFTVYKGSKELNNKIDPFGWEGKFEDPWKTKSYYLWDINPNNYNQDLNLNKSNLISNNNIELKLDLIANENTYHLSFTPLAPVFDQINFRYKENTSYKLEMSNLLNEKVISFASIRFKGFTNPQDEKKYSIFKYDGQNLIKMETMFDAEKNTLSTYTNLDGQYMVLESGIKKITARSNFKTTQ